MSLFSKRLVGIVASTALFSLVPAVAHAQTIDVLTFSTGVHQVTAPVLSIYRFSSSMILNSIGFVSSTDDSGIFKYRIQEDSYTTVDRDDTRLAKTVNGVRWYTLASPVTVNAGEYVYVETNGVVS